MTIESNDNDDKTVRPNPTTRLLLMDRPAVVQNDTFAAEPLLQLKKKPVRTVVIESTPESPLLNRLVSRDSGRKCLPIVGPHPGFPRVEHGVARRLATCGESGLPVR
jgi:hypothetical protein